MNFNTIAAALGAGVAVMLVGTIIWRRRPRKLKTNHFMDKWQELQRLCADPRTWPVAIIMADKLLDEALKKRRLKGKNMGERLVSAQRLFTDNDGVWFGHKLRGQLEDPEKSIKLRKRDVKDALLGTGQALKDIGALGKRHDKA